MTNFQTGAAGAGKIGLVAGWGRYPVVLAVSLKKLGYQVYCVAIKDHADPALRQIVDHSCEMGVAKLGGHVRYFRRHGVSQVALAGKIHKTRFIGRFEWVKHFPDLTAIKTFYHHFCSLKKDRKDDTLLTAVVDLAARNDVEIVPATDLVPELLATSGLVAGPRLSARQERDIEFAWTMAKELGRLDIGQTVVVQGQAVLAAEAIEGTDECIRRAGRLCPSGGFTVVKVSKPQQDMRFDVPTIGVSTLQTVAQAGGRVLAIEADKTILLDQSEVVSFAQRYQISLVARNGYDQVTLKQSRVA